MKVYTALLVILILFTGAKSSGDQSKAKPMAQAPERYEQLPALLNAGTESTNAVYPKLQKLK